MEYLAWTLWPPVRASMSFPPPCILKNDHSNLDVLLLIMVYHNVKIGGGGGVFSILGWGDL